MSKPVQRFDRDLFPLTADDDDSWQARIYARAEARRREAERETGRQGLRDKIGVIERPPRTLREKCLGVEKEERPSFDFARELRKRIEERERSRKVRH